MRRAILLFSCIAIILAPGFPAAVPTTYIHQPCRSLVFINSQRGFMGGDHGFLGTDDGGKSWLPIRVPPPPGHAVGADMILFNGQAAGWAGSSSGFVISTSDGGRTWTPRTSPFEVLGLSSTNTPQLSGLSFANSTYGLAWGTVIDSDKIEARVREFVLQTTDGGTHWSAIRAPANTHPLSFSALSDKILCVSERGIYVSRDAGNTWQKTASSTLLQVYAHVNENSGCAVGKSGTIMCSDDGAYSWRHRDVLTAYQLSSIGFKNTTIGWIAGYEEKARFSTIGIILLTTDVGRTWTVTYEGKGQVSSVSFIDSKEGWAALVHPGVFHARGDLVLIHTVDGSKTWNEIYASN